MTASPNSPDENLRDVERRTFRRIVYGLIITVAAGGGTAAILNVRPLLSANDRSRWCTVWSVVERGTYQIDEIVAKPGWQTIDKVRYQDHFYSTKPALLPTLVAGVYWGVKQTTGWNLSRDTLQTARLILVIVNLVPAVLALVLMALIVERYADSDLARFYVLLAAAGGTFLTTFLVTLNNHTIAAVSLLLAVYPAMRIVVDGVERPVYYAVAGFFATFTCVNELPAGLLAVALFGLLFRKSPRATCMVFVPAAVVPVAAFFATTYIASGQWLPFYFWWGREPYIYVFQGIPSYWSNPVGLDANDEPWYVYLFHCTIGHHGVLSLSPIFFLTLWGWSGLRKWRGWPLSPFLWMGLLLSVAVLGYYLTRTENYNYGGNTCGLRWLFWLIPLWLVAMLPVLDRWSQNRRLQMTAAGLLAVSVFSASYPLDNPWQHPWLYTLMHRSGWIDYDPLPAPFKRPLMTWFRTLPDPLHDESKLSWIEFAGPGFDGTIVRLRLTDGGRGDFGGRPLQKITVTADVGSERETAETYFINVESFQAGLPPGKFLRWPKKTPTTDQRNRARASLHGLPRLRPRGYRRGKVRYVRTGLRRDAFACRHAAGQVDDQAPGDNRRRRYRTELWICPDVPFGVVRVVSTVYDLPTGALLARRDLTAVAASGFDRDGSRPEARQ